jgi:voltage-gated potassium channel
MAAVHDRIKRRVGEILEPAVAGDRTSRVLDTVIIVLIATSVMEAVVWTMESLTRDYALLFDLSESFIVALFTIEYLARLWIAGGDGSQRFRSVGRARLAYIFSAHGVVDLLAFLPFFVTVFITVDPRYVHILPILRILKLMRYSPALETLGSVVYNERRTLFAAATIMLVLLLLSSSLIYLVERNAQPEVFSSIPNSMWWGIATLTTVGYGDVTPVTPLGKVLGSIVTVLGIGMFALPAGILATGFSQEIKQREFLVTWNLVAGVPMFKGLNAQEIARITRLLVPQMVQAGQVVVRKGDQADCMFFIVSGELEVELEDARKPLTGDFFGEIALLTGGTRSASVLAVTRAQLLVLNGKHFQTFLDHNPDLAETISRVAQERLAGT